MNLTHSEMAALQEMPEFRVNCVRFGRNWMSCYPSYQACKSQVDPVGLCDNCENPFDFGVVFEHFLCVCALG